METGPKTPKPKENFIKNIDWINILKLKASYGELGNNRPEKTSFLPERLPNVGGRSQGFSGLTPRSEHEKTKRTTNRSETGLRTDTLSTAAPKRVVKELKNASKWT